MARPINGDAVKRRVWAIAEGWKDLGRDYEALLLESVVEQIVDSEPTPTPPNEWVSVYDRLPEPGERVLATDCGFVGEFYINKRGQWQRYNVNCSELLMALDILYWMPLPAPPEKEDQK